MPKTNPSKEPIEKEDYYTITGRKVGDFHIGFFGVYVVFLFYIDPMIHYLTDSLPLIILKFSLFLALAILAIIISFKKGRRYIGIGIISSVIIPLLLFGACLMMLKGA